MKNYKGDYLTKTLNKRKGGDIVTSTINTNLKNKSEQSKIQDLNNTSNQHRVLELQSHEKQNGSLFNKQLLKNKKKRYQSNNNEIKPTGKQDFTSLIPSVRKTQNIGYRNIKLLRSFLTDYKKIKPRRLTRLTLKQQRQLSKSVKRARTLKLFDPRKTLKSKKFLNLERRSEIIYILLILQTLKLNRFIRLTKNLDIENLIKVTQCSKMLEDYETQAP